MANGKISADSLFREFGQAMHDAQSHLNGLVTDQQPGPDGTRLGVVIRDTEVDVKLLFDGVGETVTLRPVSVADSLAEGFDAGAVSSIKATLTAVPDEQERASVRGADEVVTEVLDRPDLVALTEIVGNLTARPTYVSNLGKWIVDVAEPSGVVVRSIQVTDIKSTVADGSTEQL